MLEPKSLLNFGEGVVVVGSPPPVEPAAEAGTIRTPSQLLRGPVRKPSSWGLVVLRGRPEVTVRLAALFLDTVVVPKSLEEPAAAAAAA